MEKDPVRASENLGHYDAVLRQRIAEMEEAAKLVASAQIQCREGAVTLAEFQAVVLNLAGFINAAIMAAEQRDFAGSAKLSGW